MVLTINDLIEILLIVLNTNCNEKNDIVDTMPQIINVIRLFVNNSSQL